MGFYSNSFPPKIILANLQAYREVERIFIANPQISTTYILPLTFYYTWFIGYLSTHRSSIL